MLLALRARINRSASPGSGFAGPRTGSGFVREKGLRGEIFQQRFCLAQIRGLPRGQGEGDGIAQSIDESMNLGRQSASGPSDRLVLAAFFWAPALCW